MSMHYHPARIRQKHMAKRFHYISIVVILYSVLVAGCSAPAFVSESWQLVALVTKGERVDTFWEVVEVRNCGIVEQKTHNCAAGTSNDLSISVAGDIKAISVEVSSGLEMDRQSGQSLALPPPPDGFVYYYTIREQYRVLAGTLRARSSRGTEQIVNYTFQASCSLQIEARKMSSCAAGSVPPAQPPKVAPSSNTKLVEVQGEVWSSRINQAHIYRVHHLSEKSLRDFSLAADVRINDASPEFHGLMFRYRDSKNFYSFRITQTGKFAFDHWREGNDSFESLLGPVESKAIRTGTDQINNLKVVARGNQFELYINGTRVGSVTDNSIAEGLTGFVSCTCDGAPSSSATFLNANLSGTP